MLAPLFIAILLINAKPSSDTLSSKYLKAIEYLYGSKELIKEVNEFFPQKNKFIVDTPLISDQIVFLDYLPICTPKMKNDTSCKYLNRSKSEIEDLYYFSDHFYFDPFRTDQFRTIKQNTASKILLYFSKPHNNFLVAIIVQRRGNDIEYSKNVNLGNALKVIFVYDENDNIIKVLKAPLIVN